MLTEKLSPYLPLTYTDIIARALKGCKSVLDIGCGKGELMRSMKRRVDTSSVGLELYLPDLHEAKKKRSHHDFILADARRLPIRPKSFDGVLCSQVIEHLDKSEGLTIVEQVEVISKFRVVIGTTVGYIPYLPFDSENGNNPFQVHKSGWSPEFFILRGYHIVFQGLKLAYGPQGIMRGVPRALRHMLSLVSYLIAPILYFTSNLAVYQVVWKNV